MVGRELHTICPNGEDHQGAGGGSRGGRAPDRLDVGREMTASRKLKAKMTTVGRLNSTLADNKSSLLPMISISLVPILDSPLDIERAMIRLVVRISPTTTWEVSWTPGTERNYKWQCGTRRNGSSGRPWSESVVHKC